MTVTVILIAAGAVALLCAIATDRAMPLVIRHLQRKAVLDHPNERSSHTAPTPRGGGRALVPAILVAWAVIAAWFALAAGVPHAGRIGWVVLAAALLAGVSWLDDLRPQPPLLRIAVQLAGIVLVLALAPLGGPIFQGILPAWLDTAATALVWLWFVNLFNFMDGIDGISAVEAIAICLGLGIVAVLAGQIGPMVLLAAAILGGTAGFLRWNWHPAKIFLGDIGSVPLGFLLGWLLLDLAVSGHWAPALILPAYYLADATITLLRRAARREKIWQAHRQHFYQHATQTGASHAAVSLWVASANGALVVAAALAATGWIWSGLAIAVAAVVLLLLRMRRGAAAGI